MIVIWTYLSSLGEIGSCGVNCVSVWELVNPCNTRQEMQRHKMH